jgi:hypothetical protein
MAIVIPTYITLFGSEAEAIVFYKDLFTTTLTDDQIKNILNISFMKISPLFGEFRLYEVGEDTVRNYHTKSAVSFEANSIANANADASTIVNGGLNGGSGGNSNITSEKMGNITTTYGKNSNSGLGGLGASIMSALGLLSTDAGVMLSRYIRKTFGMGKEVV